MGKGYRRIKIKVMPGWDVVPVAAAADVLTGEGLPLTIDANGAYEWPRDEAALRAIDATELLYFEQPLAPDELVGHARLSAELRTPICVDETLHDARWARQLIDLDGPRVWNLKVHRVGGLTEACRIVRLGAERRCVALGRDDAGVGARLPGRHRRREPSRVRLPIRRGAERPVVRGRHRHHRADHVGRRKNARA